MSEFTAGTFVGMLAGEFLGAMVQGVSSGSFDAINDLPSQPSAQSSLRANGKTKAGEEQQ